MPSHTTGKESSYVSFPPPKDASYPSMRAVKTGGACGCGSGAIGYSMALCTEASLVKYGLMGCVLSSVAGAGVGAGCSLLCYLCGNERWMGWEDDSEESSSGQTSSRRRGGSTYGTFGEEQPSEDPGEGPSGCLPPIVEQPKGIGGSGKSQGGQRRASCLIAEASLLGQVSSLHNMQCLLGNGSEQVLTTLRTLLVKEYSSRPRFQDISFVKSMYVSKDWKRTDTEKRTSSPITFSSCAPYRFFSSMKPQITTFERKICSGQVGLTIDLSPGVSLGFAYDCNKKESQEYKGAQLGSTRGLIKSKMETEGLSSIFTLNPSNRGLTGHVASCYSWGKVKNTRKIIYKEQEAIAEGSPYISLMGGLVQLGYNLPLSKQVTVVPYVECLYSSVCWRPYKEKHGPVSCKFGKNKEQVLEKSIGLRNNIGVSASNSIQFWIAGVSGYSKTNSLTSCSLRYPYYRYVVSTQAKKNYYVRTEVGMAYDEMLTNNIMLSFGSSVRFNTLNKVENQNVTLQLQYTY